MTMYMNVKPGNLAWVQNNRDFELLSSNCSLIQIEHITDFFFVIFMKVRFSWCVFDNPYPIKIMFKVSRIEWVFSSSGHKQKQSCNTHFFGMQRSSLPSFRFVIPITSIPSTIFGNLLPLYHKQNSCSDNCIKLTILPCVLNFENYLYLVISLPHWTSQNRFAFSPQDVSDRIEKEADDSEILAVLQKDSISVVRGDWKVHVGDALAEGIGRNKNNIWDIILGVGGWGGGGRVLPSMLYGCATGSLGTWHPVSD